MDKFLNYRTPQKYSERSSTVQGKILKGRLHFLGRQRELLNADVYRHICRGCGAVFHKQQGLEWHVSDEHPQLVEQLTKDLARCKVSSPPGQKRVMPQRAAAPRGRKRWRMSLEVKEEQKDESYSDIDGLLESSCDDEDEKHCNYSDIDKLLETTDDEEDPPLQVKSTKKCQVNLEKLDLRNLDYNNNKADSDSDIIVESVSQLSEEDIEVVYSGQPIPSPELVDISLSTHSVSSQPSQWSASPEDQVSSRELPRFRHAVDKVTWWLSTHQAESKHSLY